jgi:hypothetical protein
MLELDDTLASLIAEAEAALAATSAQRPALAAAAQSTKLAAEAAENHFANFNLRISQATRRGADLVAPAVMQMLRDGRRKRDVAAATRARLALENCDWAISCARADPAQLELVRQPPSVAGYRPQVEVVKRAPPAWVENFDPIEWPPGAKPPAAAE